MKIYAIIIISLSIWVVRFETCHPSDIFKENILKENKMKKLNVSTNKYPNTFALVDDEDYEFLNKWKWGVSKISAKVFYAKRATYKNGKYSTITLHKQIMNTPKGKVVDHINGKTFDNRKSNLRICTQQQNCINRKGVEKTSKYKGVSWDKKREKWRACISHKNINIFIGRYITEKQASMEYKKMSKKLHGEYARGKVV